MEIFSHDVRKTNDNIVDLTFVKDSISKNVTCENPIFFRSGIYRIQRVCRILLYSGSTNSIECVEFV